LPRALYALAEQATVNQSTRTRRSIGQATDIADAIDVLHRSTANSKHSVPGLDLEANWDHIGEAVAVSTKDDIRAFRVKYGRVIAQVGGEPDR